MFYNVGVAVEKAGGRVSLRRMGMGSVMGFFGL